MQGTEIKAIASRAGLPKPKPKGLSVLEIGKGYLKTGPQELGIGIPLASDARIELQDGDCELFSGMSAIPPDADFTTQPSERLFLLFLLGPTEARKEHERDGMTALAGSSETHNSIE
jgi:hypothetical protein